MYTIYTPDTLSPTHFTMLKTNNDVECGCVWRKLQSPPPPYPAFPQINNKGEQERKKEILFFNIVLT